MDVREHVIALNTTRMKVWEEAKAHLEDCQQRHPTEEMSGEERAKWDAFNARLDAIDAEVKTFVDREAREADAAASRDAFDRTHGDGALERHDRTELDALRAWARGDERRQSNDGDPEERGNAWVVNLRGEMQVADLKRRGYSVEEARAAVYGDEKRVVVWDTGTSGSLVPTLLARSLYEYMEAEIAALRMPTTKMPTAGGEPLNFPRVLAHGIATQVIAQGTAIGGTDPTFSYLHLDAYKYGQLLQVSSEVLQDSGVDILGFIGSNIGRAVGRLIDADLIVGTGTAEPQGMMTLGTGSAGTASTGGSLLAPSYETLVNLVYGVADSYRNHSATAWLMHDSTAGTIRKIRDGAGGTIGAVLWEPSLTQGIQGGEPDRLLGFGVYTDAYVATAGSNARIIAFGDWSAYYVRPVGNFVIERSDDYAFNTDMVTFRGKQRIDGDFIDTTATNIMKQSV